MERKSAATREREALEAALRIIERDGINAVSVRKVAAEAKMSAGSLRHIFPQQDDLLVAVFRFSMGHTRERIAQIVTRAQSGELEPRFAMVEAVMQVLPVSLEARNDLLAQLAVLLANPAHQGIRAVRSEANEGLDELCLSVVMRARGVEHKEDGGGTEEGRKKIQQDARRLRFLIDGMALNILDNPGLYGLEELRGMIAEEIFG